MKALRLIEGIKKRKYGPYPSFLPIDALRAIWNLEHRKGRGRLSSGLGIGEWSTRSILKFLKKEEVVDATPMGYKLTPKGFEFLEELRKYAVSMSAFHPTPLTLNKRSVGILVRAKKPARVLDARDEAVRMGASGITLLFFKNGEFYFVDSGDEVQREYLPALAEISSKFSFQEKDMLLLCFGDRDNLERAAWASFIKIYQGRSE